MYCPYCGEWIDDGSTYCVKCGERVIHAQGTGQETPHECPDGVSEGSLAKDRSQNEVVYRKARIKNRLVLCFIAIASVWLLWGCKEFFNVESVKERWIRKRGYSTIVEYENHIKDEYAKLFAKTGFFSDTYYCSDLGFYNCLSQQECNDMYVGYTDEFEEYTTFVGKYGDASDNSIPIDAIYELLHFCYLKINDLDNAKLYWERFCESQTTFKIDRTDENMYSISRISIEPVAEGWIEYINNCVDDEVFNSWSLVSFYGLGLNRWYVHSLMSLSLENNGDLDQNGELGQLAGVDSFCLLFDQYGRRIDYCASDGSYRQEYIFHYDSTNSISSIEIYDGPDDYEVNTYRYIYDEDGRTTSVTVDYPSGNTELLQMKYMGEGIVVMERSWIASEGEGFEPEVGFVDSVGVLRWERGIKQWYRVLYQ